MRSDPGVLAFIVAYAAFLLLVRRWANERLEARARAERERRDALEREWRVGIPYDPRDP